MSERARVHGGGVQRRVADRRGAAGEAWSPSTGRHAFDEDAALTPIFHSLRRGGARRPEPDPSVTGPLAVVTPLPAPPARRPARPSTPPAAVTRVTPIAPADPVERFRRDPITAPIPIQAPAPSYPPVAAPASPPTAPFVSPPASRDGGRDAYRRPYPESWRRSGGYGHGSPGDDTGRHHRLAPAGW